MTRRRRIITRLAIVWALVVAAVAGPAASAAGQQGGSVEIVTVDSTAFPEVTLEVAAQSDGALDVGSFRVVENGKTLPTSARALSGDSLHVVLVVDTSGSMKGAPLASALDAARTFISQLPPSVQVSVVGFGETPVVASPATTDHAAAAAAVDGLQAAGETALFDALATASAQFTDATGTRRAVVVLSDGGDTASVATSDDAASALGSAGAEVFAVELLSPEYDGQQLAAIVDATQGTLLSAADTSQLSVLYEGVAADLLGRYAVTYTSAAGGTTIVKLSVEAEGGTLSTDRTVRLPALGSSPAAAPATPAPAPTVVPEPGGLASGATLAVGLGALFIALLMTGVAVFRPREERVVLSRVRSGLTDRLAMGTLADRATAMADRALKRRGGAGALNLQLEQAGINLRAGEFIVVTAAVSVTLWAAVTLIAGGLVGLGAAAVAAFSARRVVAWAGERRTAKFVEQLADTLQLLSGGLRAGYSFMQAADAVANEGASPTKEEFRRLLVEIRLGRDLGEALDAMARRIDNDDFSWFVQAVEIHREVGGDLAQVLDSVAATIRDRNRIRGQVKALSAEGRLSAYVLGALPFGVGVILALINPGYLGELTSSAFGYGMIFFGTFLMGIGALWLKKTVKLDF